MGSLLMIGRSSEKKVLLVRNDLEVGSPVTVAETTKELWKANGFII